MPFREEYKKKLRTADEIAAMVTSGSVIDYGTCVCVVQDIDKALAKRLPELYDIDIYTGITARVPDIVQVPNAAEHMTWNSRHWTGIDRKIAQAGFAYFMPVRYSELPRYCRENMEQLNFAFMEVAPMDAHGCFNLGPTASHGLSIVDRADVVVVEVNENMPVCMGGTGANIHISEVDFIVEGSNPPIPAVPGSEPNEVDKIVARMIMNEIPNGACLQLGIGGMPNAIGSMILESDLKDLGVHSEMYVDCYVDLTLAGKITGKYKNLDRGRQVYTFAMGSQRMYDFLHNNHQCMAESVDYVNDARVIAQIDNFMSINNIVEIDLFGQVNAESAGTKHISGAGGQMDFVMGAYLSKGGKSFLCCSSTFKAKDGTLKSRIQPTLAPGSIVTDTRANVHYLVTEYGMVNLKGRTTWQRAEDIISVAHPDFREELIQNAERMNIWRRSNKR